MFIARCWATVSVPMTWRENYHVTCFLCGLRYAAIELCFLRCPCHGYITRVQESSGQLRVVVSHSREPVSQGYEAVMERSCEDSAVKC
jgi:hypothetical protein